MPPRAVAYSECVDVDIVYDGPAVVKKKVVNVEVDSAGMLLLKCMSLLYR